MSRSDISFTLKGADKGTDLVRAGDLVLFLGRLIGCVTAVDEAQNGEQAYYLRVTNLSVSSAAVSLAPIVQTSKRLKQHTYRSPVEPFGALLSAARDREPAPSWANLDVLQKTRELSDIPKNIATASIIAGDAEITIDDSFRRGIDELIGGEIETVGTISGTLDAVNLHATRTAYLYPGKAEHRIACEFDTALEAAVRASLRERVRITGLLTRRLNSVRPIKAKIFTIEILPKNSELPLFSSLIGRAPELTGPYSSEEYLLRLRDEDG